MFREKHLLDRVAVGFAELPCMLELQEFAAQRFGVPVVRVRQLDDEVAHGVARDIMQVDDTVELAADVLVIHVESGHMFF